MKERRSKTKLIHDIIKMKQPYVNYENLGNRLSFDSLNKLSSYWLKYIKKSMRRFMKDKWNPANKVFISAVLYMIYPM